MIFGDSTGGVIVLFFVLIVSMRDEANEVMA